MAVAQERAPLIISWSKRPNHNKSQILYFLAENFLTRRNEFVDKLELLTKKSKNECEKEVQLCYDSLFCFASQCDKTIGQLNVSVIFFKKSLTFSLAV